MLEAGVPVPDSPLDIGRESSTMTQKMSDRSFSEGLLTGG